MRVRTLLSSFLFVPPSHVSVHTWQWLVYQSEQEKEQELQQRLLQLEEEKNDILHESVSLEAKIRDMEQDLDTRRAVLLEKRKRREISACEAQPDVDFYKHMLAMTIESLRRNLRLHSSSKPLTRLNLIESLSIFCSGCDQVFFYKCECQRLESSLLNHIRCWICLQGY